MTRARYIPDYSTSTGIGAFLATDAKLQDAMLAIAREGQQYAVSIAPVRTGHYQASFGVETGGASPKDNRVAATLFNDASYAAGVEFGKSHILARTADYLRAKR